MRMKTCVSCEVEKEFSEFYKDATHADGYTSECKQCRKERSKRYREENKEEYLKKQKQYREKRNESNTQ